MATTDQPSRLAPALAARGARPATVLATLLAEARSYRTSGEHGCRGGCDCVGVRAVMDIHRLNESQLRRVLQLALGQLAQRDPDGVR